MVEKKKTQWKPLSADQKAMIKAAKWRELGISGKQVKKMEDNIFKKYLSEDLLKLKIDTKKFFFVGILIGSLLAVIVSFFINSLFEMLKSLESILPFWTFPLYFIVSGVTLILCLTFIYKMYVKE